jgi:hypothetical protein
MHAIFLEKAETTSLNENEEVISPEDSPDEHDDHVYLVKAMFFDNSKDTSGVEAIMGVHSTLAGANDAVKLHTDNLFDRYGVEDMKYDQVKDDGTAWYEWRDTRNGGEGFCCSASIQELLKLQSYTEHAPSTTSSFRASPPTPSIKRAKG